MAATRQQRLRRRRLSTAYRRRPTPKFSTPRARNPARLSTSRALRGCSSTASSSTATGTPFQDHQPATEEVLADIAGRKRYCRPRGQVKAPRRHPGLVDDERHRPGKVSLSGSRVCCRERSRSSRCWRPLTMANRSAKAAMSTSPLRPRTFYHAGWADKLAYAGLAAGASSAWRCGASDSVELPAAHARVEDRPALATGNTVVLAGRRPRP